MKLTHAEVIAEAFPRNFTGAVTLTAAPDPAPLISATAQFLARCSEPAVQEAVAQGVAQWSEIYSRMGAKKSDFKSSLASLANFWKRKGVLYSVNPFVDFYNAFSLSHAVPMGAYNLRQFDGDLQLGYLPVGFPFTPLGNSDKSSLTVPGEVGYWDAVRTICRYWNWRDCEQTKVEQDTTEILLIFDLQADIAAVAQDIFASFVRELERVESLSIVSTGLLGPGLALSTSV